MTKEELINTWQFALYNTGFYAEYEVSANTIEQFLEHPDITPFVTCKDDCIYTLLFTYKGTFNSFAEEHGFSVKDLIEMYLYIIRVFELLLPQTSEAKRRRLINAYKSLYNLNIDYDRDGTEIYDSYPALNSSTIDVVYDKIVLGHSFFEIDRDKGLDHVMVESAISRVNSKMWECHVNQLTPHNKPLHLACAKKGMMPLVPLTARSKSLWLASEVLRVDVPIL